MDNQPVVLVTGALTGIGRATAIAFAREKANVVVSGRRVEEGQRLAGKLRSLGAQAEFMQSDVRFEDDVRKLVDDTVARFGRLDVAVNAAGTEGEPAPAMEQTSERYAAVFDTNVLGTLLAMKHELRVMAPQGSGSIVNVDDGRARRSESFPLRGQQACGGRPHQVSGPRGGGVRRARECRRAGPR
jgi:NAD(P)-dependent dehydrogenase (short-subunit alcohol dehydrogenase family)